MSNHLKELCFLDGYSLETSWTCGSEDYVYINTAHLLPSLFIYNHIYDLNKSFRHFYELNGLDGARSCYEKLHYPLSRIQIEEVIYFGFLTTRYNLAFFLA
jgi:hypothetical protein